MAHSSISISGAGEKQQSASSRRQSRGEASFASVMAQEQSRTGGAGNASGGMPRVARLPETGSGLPLRRDAVLAGRTPNELLRLQNFSKASNDISRARSLDGLMQTLGSGGSSMLDAARNLGAARNLSLAAGSGASSGMRGFALTATDFIHTPKAAAALKRAGRRGRAQAGAGGLGKLSARFESGSDGIAAIGYDRTGGTSYGKYQIASRVGSMNSFLSFLDEKAPDLASRLRGAGPANTGSRQGRMPDVWRAIAKEQPERFESLQEAYISESHYKPALQSITRNTGLSEERLSAAMREVIWSTAVQHGPAGAARIFDRADDMSGKPGDAAYERKLINNVYALRAGQFGSSSSQVRAAVQNRFRQEKELALNMLDGPAAAVRA